MRSLIFLVALLSSTGAWAARWETAEAENGQVAAVDVSSILRGKLRGDASGKGMAMTFVCWDYEPGRGCDADEVTFVCGDYSMIIGNEPGYQRVIHTPPRSVARRLATIACRR